VRQVALSGWLVLVVLAVLVVACGHPVHGPCGALDGVRRQLYRIERENLDDDDWTKDRPGEQKDKAAEAVVSELVATCTASRWSKDAVDCLVAGVNAGGSTATTDHPRCLDEPSGKLVSSAFDKAEERTLTKLFGPPPRTALDDFADKWDQWEKRRDSPVEPRVTIPARYLGFGWFSRKEGPLFQFPGGLPACAADVLSTVAGYYQTQPLGGEPSLIAILGMLDRDKAEACFQEAVARIVPGARLERDGVFTQLITSRTVGSLGWASDGSVYWHPDRAVVEDAVAQKTTITSNADVRALVARVDRKKPIWLVWAADVTSKLIGVPSTGVRFATDFILTERKDTSQPMPRLPLTLAFASAADAQRAVAALRAPRPSLSPALAAQLAKLAPVARDRELEIDIAPLFSQPALFDEMRTALERIRTP
jgi:hypothetical protein